MNALGSSNEHHVCRLQIWYPIFLNPVRWVRCSNRAYRTRSFIVQTPEPMLGGSTCQPNDVWHREHLGIFSHKWLSSDTVHQHSHMLYYKKIALLKKKGRGKWGRSLGSKSSSVLIERLVEQKERLELFWANTSRSVFIHMACAENKMRGKM